MKTLISCAYTMDNCCVELKFRDGRMIAIDTIAVENEIADNMYQRSELDYLIYNDPIAYQYVFVSRRFRVLGSAVHGQPLRLGENDVVGKGGVYIGLDVLRVAP